MKIKINKTLSFNKWMDSKLFFVCYFVLLLFILLQILFFFNSPLRCIYFFLTNFLNKFSTTPEENALDTLRFFNLSIFKFSFFLFLSISLKKYINNCVRIIIFVIFYCFILSNLYGIIMGGITSYRIQWDWGDCSIGVIKSYANNPAIGTNYPPLAVFFYKFLNLFLSSNETQIDYSWFYIQTIFFIYFILATFILVADFTNLPIHEKIFFSISIFLSGPVLFSFCRMNIVLITLPLVLFFIIFHNSKNKILQELSLIMLAIAGNLKLYPSIFGIILIKEKKWKPGFRCLTYGILLFILPIMISNFSSKKSVISTKTESVESVNKINSNNNDIKNLIKGFKDFSNRGSLKASLQETKTLSFKGVIYRSFFESSKLTDEKISSLLNIFLVLFVFLLLFSFLFSTKNYIIYTICGLCCVLIPTMNAYYASLLMIPAFCACISLKDKNMFDYVNLSLFTASFLYVYFSNNFFEPGKAWFYFGLTFSILIESIINFSKKIMERNIT